MSAAADELRWLWGTPPSDGLRDLATDLGAGRAPERARSIKQGRGRDVFAVEDLGVLVKHFRIDGLAAVAARWTASRARREYRIMEDFRRLGIPTTRPLGCGERVVGGRVSDAWFIAEYLPDVRTLGDVLEAGDGDARDAWAGRAIDAVADLHGHPFHHRDLHVGNVLIDDDDRLRIVDLHSVWRVGRLGPRRRAATLAELLFSMRPWCDLRRDGPPLVARYAERRGERVDVVLPRVRDALEAFERDYVRGRSARCMRTSSEFVHGAAPAGLGRGGHVYRRRFVDDATLVDAVQAHERATQEPAALLGDARRSQVARVGDVGGIVTKSFRERGLFAALRARFGNGRARSAWKAGRRLEVVGLPTPRTLALCEWRDGSALLLVEHVAGRTLREALATPPAARVDRSHLAAAVGWLVGRLWREGLHHPDMSTKNLLVASAGEMPVGRDRASRPAPGTPLVHLIDLDNLRSVPRFDERALARMLGQLGDVPDWVTRSDRRRFVVALERAAGRGVPPSVVADAVARTDARRRRRARLDAGDATA